MNPMLALLTLSECHFTYHLDIKPIYLVQIIWVLSVLLIPWFFTNKYRRIVLKYKSQFGSGNFGDINHEYNIVSEVESKFTSLFVLHQSSRNQAPH
jgi:hypothetical protein